MTIIVPNPREAIPPRRIEEEQRELVRMGGIGKFRGGGQAPILRDESGSIMKKRQCVKAGLGKNPNLNGCYEDKDITFRISNWLLDARDR